MKHKLYRFLFLCLIAVLWYALARLDYRCPFEHYFGFRCFGCGMTHAARLVLQGDLQAALQTNPRIVILPLVSIYFIMYKEINYVLSKLWNQIK